MAKPNLTSQRYIEYDEIRYVNVRFHGNLGTSYEATEPLVIQTGYSKDPLFLGEVTLPAGQTHFFSEEGQLQKVYSREGFSYRGCIVNEVTFPLSEGEGTSIHLKEDCKLPNGITAKAESTLVFDE